MMTYSIANKVKTGFTLLELMIAIAIIGILAAIGVPAYNNYAIKARTSELLTAGAPYQLTIDEYVETTGSLTGFTAPTIPAPPATSNVKTITITNATGAITVTGQPGGYAAGGTGSGTNATTITLTPTVNADGSVSWVCHSTITGGGTSPYAPASCQ